MKQNDIRAYEKELENALAAFQDLTEADEPLSVAAFDLAERRWQNASRALDDVLEARRHDVNRG